jgi:hypothetical protein
MEYSQDQQLELTTRSQDWALHSCIFSGNAFLRREDMNDSSHANAAEIGLSISGKIRKVLTAQRGVVVGGGIGRRDEKPTTRSTLDLRNCHEPNLAGVLPDPDAGGTNIAAMRKRAIPLYCDHVETVKRVKENSAVDELQEGRKKRSGGFYFLRRG